MEEKWRFLPFCRDDLDTVAAIENQSFERPWNRDAIRSEAANAAASAFVLKPWRPEDLSEVGAYIFLRRIADEVHIMKLAVAPIWRRQGLAGRLTHEALAATGDEDCRRAILEVRPSNTAAIGLYTRLGFETIGKRKHYYGPTGEDALVMSKDLEEAS